MSESEENKFDELLRSRLSEKEFLFDEESWEKAEVMLDSAKRTQSAVKWSAIFLLGLFAGVGLMLPFVGNDNEASVNEITELNDKVKLESEIQNIRKEEKEFVNSNENQKRIADISHSEAKAENSPKGQMLASNESKNEIIEQNEKPVLREADIVSDKEPQVITGLASPLKKQISKVGLSETEVANTSSQNIPPTTTSSEKNTDQPETSLVHPQLTEQVSVPPSEPTKDRIVDEAGSVANLNQSSVRIPVQDSVKSNADLLIEESTSSQIDSASVVSQSNSAQAPPLAESLTSATIFSLDAGVNYGMGWNYHDTTEAQGFNPVFGIGIEHYLNPKWSLSSGVQYGSIHLKASQKTFSSKTFGFGYNSVDTIVDTKMLYYAVIPIQLHYHFNNKNSIGIGGTVSYLVNTKSTVTINTMVGDSVAVAGTPKTEIGYYAGAFRQWDASLGVAYRRRISDKFSISASASYGLIDIKSNSFFLREKFERNIGFKLVLSYNLFDF